VGVLISVGLLVVGFVRTEGGIEHHRAALAESEWSDWLPSLTARARVAGVEMAAVPDNWRPYESARHAFREAWCRREGLAMNVCGPVIDPDRPVTSATDAEPSLQEERNAWCVANRKNDQPRCRRFFANLDESFEAAWRQEWQLLIATLPSADLGGIDLTDADADGIVLSGQNLLRSRLDAAKLREAQMDGAKLAHASLVGADLYSARLEDAHMIKADLQGARLDGARLRGADLRWTDLRGALMQYVDLRTAQLDLAMMEGVFLPGADLRGIEDLTASQLADAMGDKNTLLPPGKNLQVKTCLPEPAGFETLVSEYVRVSNNPEKTLQDLRERLTCQADEEPKPTGTPCPIELTRSECQTPMNPFHTP
jgi:uncharacterized protein YjbI with pentapeptide repeats